MPASVALYWIPVGAGGNGLVRLSARLYEWIHARRERRPTTTLLHTALEVRVDDIRTIVECAWPSPDRFTEDRGVVVEGPVFAGRLGRFRPFRYEVRRWKAGVISDLAYATDVFLLSENSGEAEWILDFVPWVPPFEWGRDRQGFGDMWNSNSVIAYVLTLAGFDIDALESQVQGRSPGLRAGVVAAMRDRTTSDVPGTNDTRRLPIVPGPPTGAPVRLKHPITRRELK